ncbi:MAG: beta-ketoacyl-[acyl-carrier-protein] synthase family protein [Phycisphaerae bacterium]
MANRVVITGMGWVTPLGHDIEQVWQRLLRAESGIAPITLFDARTFPTTFAAEVKDYQLPAELRQSAMHQEISRATGFVLGAATQAWQQAGLPAPRTPDHAKLDPYSIGMYLGSGEGSLDFATFTEVTLGAWDPATGTVAAGPWAKAAMHRFNALREIEQEPCMPLTHLSLEFNARGPAMNCLTACAASTQALGEATQIIRRGDAEIMISGGAHSMIHPFGVTGFNRLTALSTMNDNPRRACRPFDATRGGFVLGEGAGILILESLQHAVRRNATILAEIVGYGSSADAYRVTDQHPEGRGAVVAIEEALRDADLSVNDIDYINAHGTGTKENDSTETLAIKHVFGSRAKSVPISSIKSMMGHLIAAAGAVEAITCVLAIRDQALPPTANYSVPDPECDLDYVPNEARKAKVNIAMSNSFGFGGQNDTLIVRRFAK